MQKAVLITGCSSGIGLCTAKILKLRGYRILAACRKPADLAEMTRLGFEPVELDLDSPESVARAAQTVLTLTNNRLYGLFNNAGFGLYGQIETISRTDLEKQFSANLFGTHQLTCLLLPAMKQAGEGRIIQTSSVMGLISTPGRGAYAASKYALEAWSDALRMELTGTGVRVSLIEPGPIATRFTENVTQTQQDKPVKNPGIARFFTGKPEDVVSKVIHALEHRNPKMRYPVTGLTVIVMWLKRLLPQRLMDKILNKKPPVA
ncbi:SDR family oxidoreductase [Morganella psychrotolerans]|uniref:Oxidoreductase n=1 Tax=Morganella psychrotolerans TaxID=368603 RepID=A0A1B8HL34_9GAMM|nr:SDR family oxidoreductase [Morganella psychrotolerans]OBU10159.1 oxidoreductase [Morganella psychrotolerans]